MPTILSLKPNVNRFEALRQFNPGGFSGLVRRLGQGPLRLMADVYVPFQLFSVRVDNGRQRQSLLMAVDAACGWLDPYRFDRVPRPEEQIEVDTRNRPEPGLDVRETGEILAEKVRRLVYSAGFFRVRELSIRTDPIPMELHVPYWLGFFGAGSQARLSVLDAVRRRFEGAKAREFFYNWLSKSPS